MPSLTLYQYHGIPEVCSVDVSCIAAQTWLRMANVSFSTVDCDTPEMAPNETLPMLRTGSNHVVSFDGLLTFIRQQVRPSTAARMYAY